MIFARFFLTASLRLRSLDQPLVPGVFRKYFYDGWIQDGRIQEGWPKTNSWIQIIFCDTFLTPIFFNPNFSLDTNLQFQLNWVIVNFSNTTQGVISTVSWKKGQNGPPPCQRMSDFCWPSSPLVSRCQHCSPPPPHIPKGGIKCFTQKSKYFLIMSKIRMIWTSSHNFLWNSNTHWKIHSK